MDFLNFKVVTTEFNYLFNLRDVKLFWASLETSLGVTRLRDPANAIIRSFPALRFHGSRLCLTHEIFLDYFSPQ